MWSRVTLFAIGAMLVVGTGVQSPAKATKATPSTIRIPLKRHSRPAPQATPAVSFLQVATKTRVPARSDTTPPPIDIFGQIRVGTPPQVFDVAIDTGSCNLLLTSADCKSAGCLAHKSYSAYASSSAKPFSRAAAIGRDPSSDSEVVVLDISSGEAEGNLVMDKVCLGSDGDACAMTGLVQMTRMSQAPFGTFPYDGILGVGMPQGSLDTRFNFIGNLADSGGLARDRFAVWMANENDTDSSELIFGDVAEDRITSEITWLPVSKYDTGMWQTVMEDFAVDNTLTNMCGTEGCQAAFDTGTNAIAAPSAYIETILAQLDVQQDCSNFDRLPLLGFKFRGLILNIDKRDYVKRVNGRCFHQFMALELTGPKQNLILLGDPFLKRYFSVFDRESLKVGLALSTHRIPSNWNVTSSEQVSMFMVSSH